MNERDKCKSCKGSKVYKDRKELEVHIEKGMKNGSKVKFAGEADEVPGTVPGDVIIQVQEKEHEVFKRKGNDLIHSIDLTLAESLCGFVKTITHLDGRVLKIESRPGSVVKHDGVKVIEGEGMPFQGNPFTKGRLFIHFSVNFPKTLPASAVAAIASALPRPPSVTVPEDAEECSMADMDLSQFGQSGGGRTGDATAEDDDEPAQRGPGGVQCQQG